MEFQMAILNGIDNKTDKWVHVKQIKRVSSLPFEMRCVQINVLKEALYSLFDDTAPLMDNMLVLEFFFESATRIGPQRDALLEYCDRIADGLTYEEKEHLVDVLPHCDTKTRILRHLRLHGEQGGLAIANKLPTYHSDRQNVHNSRVAESVNNATTQLEDLSGEYSTAKNEFLACCELSIWQTQALDTISDDTSTINLRSIFVHVWKRICASKHKPDIVIRLGQELAEMAGKCKSGHASRLINVLSGYGIDFYNIKISYDDEIKAAFLARFEKRIRQHENCDQYLGDMLSDVKSASYVLFKETACFEVYDELLADYKPLFDNATFTLERFDDIYANAINSV